MRKKELLSIFYEFDTLSELSHADQDLIYKARSAAQNAYAPYSEFKVGAAVLLKNNRCFTGNNQENSAFPSGLCAERVAVFAAKSQFPGSAMHSIALTAVIKGKVVNVPPIPCGACLQVLSENERRDGNPLKILSYGSEKIRLGESVRQFMPLVFGQENPFGKQH